MIVAEATGDRRAPGHVLFHERTNHVSLEALLVIDHVIRDADLLRDSACIVDVIERTAAPLHGLRHALLPGETPLVPELHRKADDVVPVGAQHGRDGGRIHPPRHGYGNCFCAQLLAPSF